MSISWMRGKFILLIKMIQDKFCYLCDYIGLLALNKWGDGWSESHCSYDRKMHDDSEKCASKHECYKEQGSRSSRMGKSYNELKLQEYCAKWLRKNLKKFLFVAFEIIMLICSYIIPLFRSSKRTRHFLNFFLVHCGNIWRWQ